MVVRLYRRQIRPRLRRAADLSRAPHARGDRNPRYHRRADAAEMAECRRRPAQRGHRAHGARPLSRRRVRGDWARPARRACGAVRQLAAAAQSTIAHRWLGERVGARQWLGLGLGLVGVYLVLRDKATAGEATPLPGRPSPSGSSASRSARFIRSASAAASTGGRRS